jgi:hypothetical protein
VTFCGKNNLAWVPYANKTSYIDKKKHSENFNIPEIKGNFRVKILYFSLVKYYLTMYNVLVTPSL